ncbi:MAG TPA: nucleotidyltransferase domain-containing protein [candidate division Zixibacteria bacterium]|nr:nucleotidyltransferase domain-containing protein [candidate division Zixibacteria bacterium]
MLEYISFKRESLHLDYFMEDKNRICQVLTWHHPVDRRLCIVKYDLGKSYWTSRETGLQYQRMLKSYSLEGHQDNLINFKSIEPDYFYHSQVYDVDFLAVPIKRIKRYFYPEDRLKEIIDENIELDEIERKVKKLAELLHDYLKIPIDKMGITGSIVWKAQTEKSDIDFIIYGNDFAQDFNDKFPIIYDVFPEIRQLPNEKRKRYEVSMAKKSGLPISLVKKYILKKKWLSIYDKTNLSLIFSPLPSEIPFIYGEQFFKPIQSIDLKCSITNCEMGFAYPAIYEIENYELLTPIRIKNLPIKRILSFEGALTGYFSIGEEAVVRGLLEEVLDKDKNPIFYQLILGTKECVGNEFIVYLKDYQKLFE